MKKLDDRCQPMTCRLLAVVLALLCAACTQGGPFARAERPVANMALPAATNEDYRLGTGDVISIRVYGGEEDLRLEKVRLDTSGAITLAWGEFKVLGRTTREVEQAILERVSGRILKNARVWVSIDEYRPFFVEGQVGRPGAYPYQPGLNVRRAVTIAGGFRERAAPDKIFVVRENDKSGRGIRADLNAPVAPGDTVTVQESFF